TGDGNSDHVYGGTFSLAGDLFANFFPMFNMTEAAGFGGIRRFPRGPQPYSPVIGITGLTLNYVNPSNPTSYGIFVGSYAGEPTALSDGTFVISWAADVAQDYGLYQMHADGSGLTPLYDNPGTSELRAKPLRPRPLPPIIVDTITQIPSLLPPPTQGPY